MTMRNLRRWGALALAMTMIWGAGACGSPDGQASQTPSRSPSVRESTSTDASVTPGTEQYRGFTLDNVLHSPTEGDIHFNMKLPDNADGGAPMTLFLTLPGYQGLYRFGVGENLRTEDFAFTAPDYADNMMIVAPQLEDWQDTSARKTIALTEYLLAHYNIDRSRVYAEGYSGGGETMSRALGMRPDLFTAYLQCASQFDGDLESVAKSRTPVRLVIGAHDEYYGADPSRQAYERLRELYRGQGMSDAEIDKVLLLDVRPDSYFEQRGASNQHGEGARLFARDPQIMGWLFEQR